MWVYWWGCVGGVVGVGGGVGCGWWCFCWCCCIDCVVEVLFGWLFYCCRVWVGFFVLFVVGFGFVCMWMDLYVVCDGYGGGLLLVIGRNYFVVLCFICECWCWIVVDFIYVVVCGVCMGVVVGFGWFVDCGCVVGCLGKGNFCLVIFGVVICYLGSECVGWVVIGLGKLGCVLLCGDCYVGVDILGVVVVLFLDFWIVYVGFL